MAPAPSAMLRTSLSVASPEHVPTLSLDLPCSLPLNSEGCARQRGRDRAPTIPAAPLRARSDCGSVCARATRSATAKTPLTSHGVGNISCTTSGAPFFGELSGRRRTVRYFRTLFSANTRCSSEVSDVPSQMPKDHLLSHFENRCTPCAKS